MHTFKSNFGKGIGHGVNQGFIYANEVSCASSVFSIVVGSESKHCGEYRRLSVSEFRW